MEPLDPKVANRAASGAPGTIRIGGKVYLASIVPSDMFTLRSRLSQAWHEKNKSPLVAVAQALKDMPADLREIVQAGAISRATDRQNGNKAPEPGDLAELITDPEIAAFWAWYLCRKNHPELTIEMVEQAVKDPAQVNDILADLMIATSLKAIDPNAPGPAGSN